MKIPRMQFYPEFVKMQLEELGGDVGMQKIQQNYCRLLMPLKSRRFWTYLVLSLLG